MVIYRQQYNSIPIKIALRNGAQRALQGIIKPIGETELSALLKLCERKTSTSISTSKNKNKLAKNCSIFKL